MAAQNVRGLGAERLGMVLRLSLVGIVLLLVVSGIALAQNWDPAAITDSDRAGLRARVGPAAVRDAWSRAWR